MIKQLVKAGFGYFGYELSKVRSNEFTLNGIRYETSPSSVGITSEGSTAAEGAIRLIKEHQQRNLKILDIGCGVGVIGLTIFTRLGSGGVVSEVAFADINIFNLHCLSTTLKRNNLQHLSGDRIRSYLSDGLQHVPKSEKYDLIIGNPPHYHRKESTEVWLSPRRLGTYDADWGFHEAFYNQCAHHLSERGEVWLFENATTTTVNDFLPFVQRNSNLKFVREIPEPADSRFYWMITQRVSPALYLDSGRSIQ